MPFAEVQRPSIALGLLHAAFCGYDDQSEVSGNFTLPKALDGVYQAMQSAPTITSREWCFAGNLFPVSRGDEEY